METDFAGGMCGVLDELGDEVIEKFAALYLQIELHRRVFADFRKGVEAALDISHEKTNRPHLCRVDVLRAHTLCQCFQCFGPCSTRFQSQYTRDDRTDCLPYHRDFVCQSNKDSALDICHRLRIIGRGRTSLLGEGVFDEDTRDSSMRVAFVSTVDENVNEIGEEIGIITELIQALQVEM